MRGEIFPQEVMFSYRALALRIAADHSIRKVRKVVDQGIKEMAPPFDQMYSRVGRPGVIPPF